MGNPDSPTPYFLLLGLIALVAACVLALRDVHEGHEVDPTSFPSAK